MTNWKLHKVEDIDAIMDDSGVYVVINRVCTPRTFKDMAADEITVRADLMGQEYVDSSGPVTRPTAPVPIISFIGKANAVRKHLIRYLMDHLVSRSEGWISQEHASYIGYELLRAETTPNYVQD